MSRCNTLFLLSLGNAVGACDDEEYEARDYSAMLDTTYEYGGRRSPGFVTFRRLSQSFLFGHQRVLYQRPKHASMAAQVLIIGRDYCVESSPHQCLL